MQKKRGPAHLAAMLEKIGLLLGRINFWKSQGCKLRVCDSFAIKLERFWPCPEQQSIANLYCSFVHCFCFSFVFILISPRKEEEPPNRIIHARILHGSEWRQQLRGEGGRSQQYEQTPYLIKYYTHDLHNKRSYWTDGRCAIL